MKRGLSPLLCSAAFAMATQGAEPRIELLAPSSGFGWDGRHLLLADLDHDGDTDLIHLPNGASSLGDPHACWIENLGNRRFATLQMLHVAPTGPGEALVFPALSNLTGDAKPEFFVNRQTADRFEPLALAAAFSPPIPAHGAPLAGSTPEPWHAADLDDDGQGELIRITRAENEVVTVAIFDRNPAGDFEQSATFETSGFTPYDIAAIKAIDLDADGDLDLSLTTSGGLLVFERTSVRGFDPSPIVFEETFGESAWADVNGDGLSDLLYRDGSWQENDGGFEFTAREVSPAFAALDSLVFKSVVARPGQSALVHAILPMAEEGYELVTVPFDAAEPISRTTVPGSYSNGAIYLQYADLDGDGLSDLIHSYSTDESFTSTSRVLAVAWGPQLTVSQTLVAAPSMFSQTFPGDFNHDKFIDLIAGPDAEGFYWIRFNRGELQPGAAMPLNGLARPGMTMRLLGVADMNKDRILDLVCIYSPQTFDSRNPMSAITVVRGRRNGSFVLPTDPPPELDFTPSMTMDGDLVDWDRDGDLDFVGGGLWRENVGGKFPSGQRLLVGLGTMLDFIGNPVTIGGTITGDLDGDRVPDIISIIHGEGMNGAPPREMLIAYNDGFGGIEEAVTIPAVLAASDFLGNPTVPGSVAIADLNADKLPDLWIREVSGSDFLGNPTTVDRWLRNPGRGSRDPSTWVSLPLPGGVAPGAAFVDFDGDRQPEWVSPSGFLKPTRSGPLFSGGFDFSGGIELSREPLRASADFDGDGDADFIIGGGDSPLLLLRNHLADERKRRFVQPQPIRWQGQPVVR